MTFRASRPSVAALLVAALAFNGANATPSSEASSSPDAVNALALTTLHSFVQADGSDPTTLLRLPSGALYGTTRTGGSGNGTIFKISAAGAFSVLHTFAGAGDGATPAVLATGADGLVYGVTSAGGDATCHCGTLFRFESDGTFTVLHKFTGTPDGSTPTALYRAADRSLVGATKLGGAGNVGTVFQVDGAGDYGVTFSFTASIAGFPTSLLESRDGNLYGTGDGANGVDLIFQLTPSGTLSSYRTFLPGFNEGQTPLHLVESAAARDFYLSLDSDPSGSGQIVHITPDKDLIVAYQCRFTDCQKPFSLSATANGTIVGTAGTFPGTFEGFVFTVPVGGSLQVVYSFTNQFDGVGPRSAIAGPNGTIYGTTTLSAGNSCCGTVFKLFQPDALTPTVTDFVPASGPAGTSVTVAGTHFNGATKVKVAGIQATFSVQSDSTISVVVPAAAQAGPISVESSHGSGRSAAPFEATAGILTTVHTFCLGDTYPGCSDASFPNSMIVASDGNFYGTARFNAWKLSPTGTLTPLSNQVWDPTRLLEGLDGNLYGMNNLGGNFGLRFCDNNPENPTGCGSVIRLTKAGAYTELYDFKGRKDGGFPVAGLVRSPIPNTFFGTAPFFGQNDDGTLFITTTDGRLVTIHAFTGPEGARPNVLIRGTDGAYYGTASDGGIDNHGTVFRLDPATLEVSAVHQFTNGADGADPSSLLQAADGTLYGTTAAGGGTCNCGVVFSLTPDGTLSVLHTFEGNLEGTAPSSLIRADDGTLYGITEGGRYAAGTVFRLDQAEQLTTLYAFYGGTGTKDGADPSSLIQTSDGTLWGTTEGDLDACFAQPTSLGCGTVFHVIDSLADAPSLQRD